MPGELSFVTPIPSGVSPSAMMGSVGADGVDRSGEDVPTYVLSPSPVLWLQEIELLNARTGCASPWHDFGALVRLRGSSPAAQWPGPVLLPSHSIRQLVEADRFKIPEKWAQLSKPQVLRFLAVLYAWQMERQIFEFGGFAAEIVLHSQVRVPLTRHTFSKMPSCAIYVDFGPLGDLEQGLPVGAFVGFDTNANNDCELVIAVDRSSSIRLLSVPLKGQTLDELLARVVSRMRSAEPNNSARGVCALDRHLHAILAAVLVVCSSQGKLVHVPDGISRDDGRALWSRWRAEAPFGRELADAYQSAMAADAGREPIMVAEWVEPSKEGMVAGLRCRIGSQVQWRRTRGLPAVMTATK